MLHPDLPRAALGEGAFWCAEDQVLYWVDIEGKRLHRYGDTQGHHSFDMPSAIGFVLKAEDGRLALGLADGVYLFECNNALLTPFAMPADMPAGNRFNDAKCDPAGRLWAGTISETRKAEAALYTLQGDELQAVETGLVNSNGLGWSPDADIMYFNDTARHITWAYDYDLQSGQAFNRRVFIDHGKDGKPDGLCMDVMGHIYCASFSQGVIDIFAPDGRHMQRIDVPADHVTSCAFGGVDMQRLFITTAGENGDSGRLFYCDMDIAGLPATPMRLQAAV